MKPRLSLPSRCSSSWRKLLADQLTLELAQRVVHVRTRKYDVYVGRGRCPKTGRQGGWGNPFSHLTNSAAVFRVATREEAVAKYREWLLAQPELVEKARRELRGRVLGCWCMPEPCHGTVLAEIANG